VSFNLDDAHEGMNWWNSLPEELRRFWMDQAGNTGVVADAWEAFKRGECDPPDE
jgi:hypothetical protein